MKNLFCYLTLIVSLAGQAYGSRRVFTSIDSIVFTGVYARDHVHHEYMYGDCHAQNKSLYRRIQITPEQLGDTVVYHLLTNTTLPIVCIKLLSVADVSNAVRYAPSRFTVCYNTIIYFYNLKKFTTYLFEWFLPIELNKDIVWHLYLYTPHIILPPPPKTTTTTDRYWWFIHWFIKKPQPTRPPRTPTTTDGIDWQFK